jgi:hypothetical protein
MSWFVLHGVILQREGKKTLSAIGTWKCAENIKLLLDMHLHPQKGQTFLKSKDLLPEVIKLSGA